MRLIDADYIDEELSQRDNMDDYMMCSMSLTYGRHKELIKAYISTVPTIKQKTGIWIDCPFNNLIEKRMMCDQCGSIETNLNHANFCPNCGAKMEGGKNGG